MSENHWGAARIRAEADRLTVIADQNPTVLDATGTGAVGYLLMDVLDEDNHDFATRLEQAMRLLRHGAEFAPDDPLACSWRISLSFGHTYRAIAGDAAEWEPAFHWGGLAVATAGKPEEYAEAVLDLVNLHMSWVEDLWEKGNLSVAEQVAELDKVSAVLRGFDGTLADAFDQATLDYQAARVFGTRFDLMDEPDDLERAIAKLGAPTRLPDDHPCLSEALYLLAELRRLRFRLTENEVELTAALDTAVRVIGMTGHDDPARGERHLLLARLLMAKNNLRDQDDPDDRDRLIESLRIVVAADPDPDLGWTLGGELFNRGKENGDPADLRAAISWLQEQAELQDPAGEDAWLPWSMITEAHSLIFDLTREQEHADRTVECATRALEFPMPEPVLVEEMHWRRLDAVFQNGERPDLSRFFQEHPVLDWLRDAGQVVDESRRGEPTETGELLAAKLGLSWFAIMTAAPNLVVTYPADLYELIDRMQGLFQGADVFDDMSDEERLSFAAMHELVVNLGQAVNGDGVVDFSNLQQLAAAPSLRQERADLLGFAASLLLMVGSVSGSLRAIDAGIELCVVIGRIAERPVKQAEADALQGIFRLLRAFHARQSPARIYALGKAAWERMVSLPESSGLAPILKLTDIILRPVTRKVGADPLPALHPSVTEDLWLERLFEPFVLSEELSNAALNRDVEGVRVVCRRLDDLMERSSDPTVNQAVQGIRATAYGCLSTLNPSDPAVLDDAIDAHTELLDWLRGDDYPGLEDQLQSLADLLRRRGGPDDLVGSRRVGMDVLENAGWRVLLQSESAEALEIARTAVPTAEKLVGWCIEDDAVADLIGILDSRRSLVLHAANTSRSVSALLTGIGRADLAAEWEAAGGLEQALLHEHGGPGNGWGVLRRKVLMALTRESRGILTPPTVEELQKTLRAQGSDVLAYLLPANDQHEAVAVMVPREGEPVVRSLPALGRGSQVERYQAAYGEWDGAADRVGPEYLRWRDALKDLCDWSWRAAGEQLLEFGRQHAGDRDPRIVLVPIGMLGQVPWHAANRLVGDRRRYLLQDATISYVPSGRLFCEAVGRTDVDSECAVLVGNPGRNLLAGGVEAKAVRDSFYADGVLLGGTGQQPRRWVPAPEGPGKPSEVLDHLRSPLRLMHLACHAVANMRDPLLSTIELAGEPRSDLSATELLALSPTRPLDVGLVVLAGCTTHVSGSDYDEALTLSTTFLALGTRTVIGSLWRVPAGWVTAHLMFLFHHNLRHELLPPGEALRRAQISLLDPEPKLPETMPDELKNLRPATVVEIDVEHWAGFTHQGR
ncbi:hypothetical protein GCM10027598_60850 [Amycolatopsis oliviviridis]|uniref:CHAT domain-containing protein n=1 Tax=Amycolatopsis oliviviridis TaxID=1471590 RepID=A0ABQ3M4F3_9PSEU|nr:CHAT domain-containing protein [Amycolatopsis oliviviridis]GHH32278.1 hypothetical protein GCM10017790_69150 [Amycolatopsis oliviviridis]